MNHEQFNSRNSKILSMNVEYSLSQFKWRMQLPYDQLSDEITLNIDGSNKEMNFVIPTYKGGIEVSLVRNDNAWLGTYNFLGEDAKRNVSFTFESGDSLFIGKPEGFANNEIWKLIKQID